MITVDILNATVTKMCCFYNIAGQSYVEAEVFGQLFLLKILVIPF